MTANKIPPFPKPPEIKFSKNGYELRTDILGMAQNLILEEYKAKYMGWEITQYKDTKTGQLISSVEAPEFPGLDKIIETAQRMYDFVNLTTKNDKDS